MKLSRTVTYALQATLQLAQADQKDPISCSKLAAAGDMPERFLLQILRNLVNHGILQSTRGVEGGYSLVRSPESISLLDIIEAIDGPVDTKMSLGNSLNGEAQNRLQEALRSIASSARSQLEQVKVAHLVASLPDRFALEAKSE